MLVWLSSTNRLFLLAVWLTVLMICLSYINYSLEQVLQLIIPSSINCECELLYKSTFVLPWIGFCVPRTPNYGDQQDDGRHQPRRLASRPAHLLIRPFRFMNRSSGSSSGLRDIAYLNARDHFDRVRLSTFVGSAVQRIIAANGSSPSNGQILRNRSAQ
jgi:hypothetical protein